MGNRLGVALLWHLHQPYYKEPDGRYRLPWVYLHAIKDYAEMAAHLEAHPAAKATVNWTPTLLTQLSDYAVRLARFLDHGEPVGDRLLDWLSGAVPLPEDLEGRRQVVQACRRANPPTMVHPHPHFHHLLAWVEEGGFGCCCERLRYLNDQFLYDLLTWYHLAWCGVSLRQKEPTLQRLAAQAAAFSGEDRRALVRVIAETIATLPERYRRLAERGQIELSLTPYGHPIAPLLLDFAAAHESRPQDPLPEKNYPGGAERLRWHLDAGFALFEELFGFRPNGLWPAEGAICERSLALFAEYGVQWCASGEKVWFASAQASGWDTDYLASKHGLFAPIAWRDQPLRLFFRDDGLSDMIGFTYQHWRAEDAVEHLVAALERIAASYGLEAGEHTVLIALDGENAWEYYPNNGWDFLTLLYERLSHHPKLVMRTVSEAVAARRAPNRLERVRAGSWVQGNLATWIGSDAKNRAWAALVALKEAIDARWATWDEARRAVVAQQLAYCEASDWFWWFADHNPLEAVTEFDFLFRAHLAEAYRLLGSAPPEALAQPFPTGGGAAELGGTMQRAQ